MATMDYSQSAPFSYPQGLYLNNYRKYQPNTAVLFGTSLEAQGDSGADSLNPSNQNGAVNGRGWLNWAKAFLGQKVDLVANSGVSGNTSTQMLARVVTDVLSYNPGIVFIGGPVNDAPSSISSSTTISNLTSIYTALAGRLIVQLNLAPRDTYNTTQMRQDVSDVNEWLRNVHTLFPNVIVIDIWRLLAVPATGVPATNMSVDGTHYTESAALKVGKAVADRITALIPERPKRTLGLLDPRNVIGNPDFTAGTGWTTLVAGSTTITYPADDETFGSQANIVVAGNTDNAERGVRYVEPITNNRYAVGDIIQVSARIRWSGLNPYVAAPYFSHPHLRMRMRLADTSYAVDTYGMFVPSGAYATVSNMPSSGDVIIKTPRFTVPTNTANIYIDAGWMGILDGTIKVSELAVARLA